MGTSTEPTDDETTSSEEDESSVSDHEVEAFFREPHVWVELLLMVYVAHLATRNHNTRSIAAFKSHRRRQYRNRGDMSHSLNSLKGAYIGGYIRDYYRGY